MTRYGIEKIIGITAFTLLLLTPITMGLTSNAVAISLTILLIIISLALSTFSEELAKLIHDNST